MLSIIEGLERQSHEILLGIISVVGHSKQFKIVTNICKGMRNTIGSSNRHVVAYVFS